MSDQQHIIDAFSEMAPNYEAKVDAELHKFWGLSYPDVVRQMLAVTEITREDCVLDLATGTSALPIELFRDGKRPASVTGLDITYPMLVLGKKKVETAHPGAPIHLTCGSAHCLPFRNASYDLVLCGLAAHHMQVEALLGEAYRVLAPGGRITLVDVGRSRILSLPGMDRFIGLAAYAYFLVKESRVRARAETSAIPHVYTAGEWVSHLSTAGFCEVNVAELPTSNHWLPVPLIIKARK